MNVGFKKAYPFSVFKRADRPSFLVSFKDNDGNYLPPLSTKMKTEKEALKVAFQWLRDGIPQKKTVLRVNHFLIKDMVRKLKDGEEAEIVMSEMRRFGWVKSYVRNDTPGAVDFISFLKTFWDGILRLTFKKNCGNVTAYIGVIALTRAGR